MGNQVTLDVGPVFIRVVWFFREPSEDLPPAELKIWSETRQGTFYFAHITREQISDFFNSPLYKKIKTNSVPVRVTGLTGQFDLSTIGRDHGFSTESVKHTPCVINAIDLLFQLRKETFFMYEGTDHQLLNRLGRPNTTLPTEVPADMPELYPYLLVNVRGGLSVYKVEDKYQFNRVSSSSWGGATFWALMRLMTSFKTPEEALTNAINGDASKIDMTVGDIYGGSYLDLDPNIIASSCGKIRNQETHSDNDIARSILTMFLYNLTQIVYLTALFEDYHRLIVVGNFMDVPEFMMGAQACIDYWVSQRNASPVKLIFSHVSSFLGSVGALIEKIPQDYNVRSKIQTSSRVQAFLAQSRIIKDALKMNQSTRTEPSQNTPENLRKPSSKIEHNRTLSPTSPNQKAARDGKQVQPVLKQPSRSPSPNQKRPSEDTTVRFTLPTPQSPVMATNLSLSPKSKSPKPRSNASPPVRLRSPQRQKQSKPRQASPTSPPNQVNRIQPSSSQTRQAQTLSPSRSQQTSPESPAQSPSSDENTTKPQIDEKFIENVESLLEIVSRRACECTPIKEKNIMQRVITALENYKNMNSVKEEDKQKSDSLEYKTKAKKMLTCVMEETMTKDDKLEALKVDKEVLQKRLLDGDTPSPNELINSLASNHLTQDWSHIAAKLDGVSVGQQYEPSIKFQTAKLFSALDGNDELFQDLTTTFAKKIVREKDFRQSRIKKTATTIQYQKLRISKLLQKEAKLNQTLRAMPNLKSTPEESKKEEGQQSPETRVRLAKSQVAAANKNRSN